MHVTVELGLQTTFEETSDLINRAHSYELYVETVKRLRKFPKIQIVAHLINGLPGETHEMMVEMSVVVSLIMIFKGLNCIYFT